MSYSPLENITIRRLDFESEYTTDYAFGSFHTLHENAETIPSGVHIDITANRGYLEYYEIPTDKIRELTHEFTQRINDLIESDYIEQSGRDAERHAEHIADLFTANVNDAISFITSLESYREYNYRNTPHHIEFRSYSEQIKRAKRVIQSAIDRANDLLSEL